MRIILALTLAALFVLPAKAQDHTAHDQHKKVELYTDLGDHHHEISTISPEAQKLFNQGLTLAYGFNHAEAEAAFKEAARLDPDCAMCYWGIAFVHGPNINAPMFPESVPVAWEALQKALEASKKATPREQAYIRALAKRYAEDPPEDRSELDVAFADAMRELVKQYPDDLDAQTIFAESLMDTMPWDYYDEDGNPREATKEVLAALELVMERDSTHPGANHFYIHAVEKTQPEKGIAAADRLGSLVPAAGHLVHMPGHIYIRVGRYHDAVLANEAAIEADEKHGLRHVHGIYPMMYMPHNHHFLWAAAALEGNSARAIKAAYDVREQTDTEAMRQPGMEMLQHFYVTPLYALARFSRWDEILAEPAPDEDLLYPRALWHYVRGLAYAQTDRLNEARAELEAMKEVAAEPSLETMSATGINTARALLDVGEHALEGYVAAAADDMDGAEQHFRMAIEQENALIYEEPPPWYHSTRVMLADVLLDAGHAAKAEELYREDLKIYPDNGWALHGLSKSMRLQAKHREADEALTLFKRAWANADVKLADDL